MAKLLDTTITGVANVSSTLNVVSRIHAGSSVNVAGHVNAKSLVFTSGAGRFTREPLAISATDAITINGAPFQISDSGPTFHLWNTATDELWSLEAGNGNFNARLYNSAWNDGNTWLSVYATGLAVSEIDVTAGLLFITTDETTLVSNVAVEGFMNVTSTLNVTSNILSNSNVFASNVVATGTMNASVMNSATFIKTSGHIMPNITIGTSTPPAGNAVNDLWVDTN